MNYPAGAIDNADQLLALQGIATPADNPMRYKTAIHWKSDLCAQWVQNLYNWDSFLGAVSESPWIPHPVQLGATLQRQIIDFNLLLPIRNQAQDAVLKSTHPDPFRAENQELERKYAELLQTLCGHFLIEGKYDTENARNILGSRQGCEMLYHYMGEFAQLEYRYHSLGLTRMAALKELLKTILMLITETPISGLLPYPEYDKEGNPKQNFDEYLKRCRQRMESLYAEQAFDIVAYANNSPHSVIGCCTFHEVEGSCMQGVRLRHYPLPGDIKPCNTVVYLSSPLINRPEIFDLAPGKSVIEGLLAMGYEVYLTDYSGTGPEASHLGLDFFGKEVHDRFLDLIKDRHPGLPINVMGYCMGGTLILPYLARRAEERYARGEDMDITRVALMATPVKFDDQNSGHIHMRDVIRTWYNEEMMTDLFSNVNIPPQLIEVGMNQIQPGVQYTVANGFYHRATQPEIIRDSAPFLHWLNNGTAFPAAAHREWIRRVFIGNQIWLGNYTLPSSEASLDQQPVNMQALTKAGVAIMDYRGDRDPISPKGSCVASLTWGSCLDCNQITTTHGLNRTIEKNVGHIFVVSRKHLSDYLDRVSSFYNDRTD